MTARPVGRRPVILAGVGAAAGASLAGCGSSGSSGSSGGGSGSGGSGGGSGGSGGELVEVSAVPVGGSAAAKGKDGKPVIVSQPSAGTIVAFTAICTHKGCTVAPAGAQLKCPCHGSVYDAFTGKNISGPAPKPLAEISVTVSGGKVVEG